MFAFAPARPPAKIIHIPPYAPSRADLMRGVIRGSILVWVLAFTVIAAEWREIRWAMDNRAMPLAIGAIAIATPLVFLVALWFSRREQISKRRRFWERYPDAKNDKNTHVFASLSAVDRNGYIKKCAAILGQQRDIESSRTQFIVVDYLDIRPVGAERVEPTVVTPGASVFVRLLPIYAIFALFIAFTYGFPSPRMRSTDSESVLLFAAFGLVSGVAWWWLTTVQPRYVRFAPGIVEILRYRPFSHNPRVQRFPLDGRTHVFVEVERLSLWRDGQKTIVSTHSLSDEDRQRIWSALLSTAPTPPLDDEQLVG